jgi:uncharacterized membrane protein
MKRLSHWFIFIAIIAVISHLLVVRYTPQVLMALIMFNINSEAGGANHLYIPERITAKSRKIVRPAPDLAYTACAYDLSNGPVMATLTAADTYTSLAVFADNTDNFFAINDQAITGDQVTVILRSAKHEIKPAENMILVQTPSDKGLILWRRVIASNSDWPQVDAARRAVNCEPYQETVSTISASL